MKKTGGLAGLLFAALGIAIAMTAPARAGAREDALSGAIRCGSVAQDRQWLDCYYGAAQPMRAQLRLSPAPQTQVALAATAQGGPMGGARQDVLSGAIRCGGIADDRGWLDCYYGSAQPMRAVLGLSPAPQAPAQAPARAQVQAMPAPPPPQQVASAPPPRMPPSPGFFDALFGDDPVIAKTVMESYVFDAQGFFTATLANGQVWRQVSGDFAHWSKAASTYKVTLSRGVLRTFNIRIEGDPNLYKVRRLR